MNTDNGVAKIQLSTFKWNQNSYTLVTTKTTSDYLKTGVLIPELQTGHGHVVEFVYQTHNSITSLRCCWYIYIWRKSI